MRTLNPDLDLDRFFATLRRPEGSLLLLDYDGTLAPFHRRPERALPYPRVAEVLRRLTRVCGTRVAIVTGRRFADLRGPLAWIPHTEVWAAHGWERVTANGERVHHEPAGEARRQLQLAEAMARPLVLHGARIEPKAASVAVHWRGLAPRTVARVQQELASAWDAFENRHVTPLPFDGGLELCAHGRGKGDAVREALEAVPRGAACAYLGDDINDEAAFAAIRGRGLGVLVRPELRETGADLWLTPPVELLAFLEEWCAAGAVH